MRYLLISDIHSNLEALEASLQAAERLEPYQLMCLGDLVGYGADPASCIDTIGNRANLILAGNHDLAVAGVIPFVGPGGAFVSFVLNLFHIAGVLGLVVPVTTWRSTVVEL